MPRLAKKSTKAKQFRQFIADPKNIAQALADSDPPDQLKAWLKRLGLLHGVPFNYLVPNDKMLPDESIRFFQVDFNWLYALIEGACSIGHGGEQEDSRSLLIKSKLQVAASISSQQEPDQAPAHMTGFFMRSQVVAGWPKLEVVAFDAQHQPLTHITRMDHLSDSILLYMVEGQIDYVLIREPAVGLHFGIDISGDKFLRYVTVPETAPAGTKPGDQMTVKPEKPVFRGPDKRTLKINQLAVSMAKDLHDNNADNAPDGSPLPFTSAEFTLEMVEGTQEVKFQNTRSEGE